LARKAGRDQYRHRRGSCSEELVDEPEELQGITRVSGPFTVEAVMPAEISLDEAAHTSPIDGAPEALDDTFDADNASAEPQNAEAYLDQMLRLLKMDGVRFLDNRAMKFSRLDPLDARSQFIHAEGRWAPEGDTDGDPEGRATVAVAFGPQYGPVTAKQVEQLIRAASRRGYDELVVAGFAFDGAAQAAIEEAEHPDLRVHMAHIRPDVNPGMAGLLKDTPAAQLFTVFGKPRSRLEPADDNEWRVVMEGVDIYDPVSNTITPSRADKVAAWFIDSDYDGRTFCITQAFFPDKDAWSKLSAALKGVVDEEAFAALSGTVSLPFPAGEHGCVAVKVIDPRGNEVMRLHRFEG
jgi:adenine-specific DNA-methyltransferase